MQVLTWLLDSDPAIRWQVLRDLTDAPEQEALAERARVATEGWGARLLALQGDDGQWDGGTYFPARVEPEVAQQQQAVGRRSPGLAVDRSSLGLLPQKKGDD